MITHEKSASEASAKPDEPEQVKLISAQELFGRRREVWIDHAGVRYRLRITRRNKLILQK